MDWLRWGVDNSPPRLRERLRVSEAGRVELQQRLDASEAGRAQLQQRLDEAESMRTELQSRLNELEAKAAVPPSLPAPPPTLPGGLKIKIERGGQSGLIDPAWFEDFPMQEGDLLAPWPASVSAEAPITWGDANIRIGEGYAIRVPARWETCEFRGFRMPAHLVRLTGAGPETLEPIGHRHIENYKKHTGLTPGMTIVDIGCGIGRDAFHLLDYLDQDGSYIGIDVTRDSIVWCQKNITARDRRFTFHHADAFSELYNPHGAKSTKDIPLPAADQSVDRIVLASVFTHLLEDEVQHYLAEFKRVLKPSGLVYANFFLYSPEALASAAQNGNTAWTATFANHFGGGVYGNDPDYPRGAVAYSDEAMRRLIEGAGLHLHRPFLKGWWSGLHAEPEDGQDAAIIAASAGTPDQAATSQSPALAT